MKEDKKAKYYIRVNPSHPGIWNIFHVNQGKDANVGEVRLTNVGKEGGGQEKRWIASMFFVSEEGDTPQKALDALLERYNKIYKTQWSTE